MSPLLHSRPGLRGGACIGGHACAQAPALLAPWPARQCPWSCPPARCAHRAGCALKPHSCDGTSSGRTICRCVCAGRTSSCTGYEPPGGPTASACVHGSCRQDTISGQVPRGGAGDCSRRRARWRGHTSACRGRRTRYTLVMVRPLCAGARPTRVGAGGGGSTRPRRAQHGGSQHAPSHQCLQLRIEPHSPRVLHREYMRHI